MGFFSIRACLLGLLLVLFFFATTSPAAASSTRRCRTTRTGRSSARARASSTTPRSRATSRALPCPRCSGSLRRKGIAGYFQFGVPTGVVVQLYVERVVLVYHDLGNWSDYYYPLPGYTYLAPVLGLLVYDAANLSAVGLQELNIVASGSPISVSFGGNVRAVPAGSAAPRCVVFDLDGMPQFRDLVATDMCSTYRQGHVSTVVNSSGIAPAAPPPGAIAPPIPTTGGNKKGSSKAWKIAVSVVGAAIAFGLLASLVLRLVRYKRDKKLQVMERNAEVGETLRMAQVGRTQAPVALGTRTQPVIENDYTA